MFCCPPIIHFHSPAPFAIMLESERGQGFGALMARQSKIEIGDGQLVISISMMGPHLFTTKSGIDRNHSHRVFHIGAIREGNVRVRSARVIEASNLRRNA